MKVCFIAPGATSLFYPELPPHHGGAELQFYCLARELAAHENFEIHFIVNGVTGRESESIDRMQLHFLQFAPGLRCKLRLQRLLLAIDADVYLQRAIGSLTKEIAFFALWRRKKFIYWIANDIDVDLHVDSEEYTRNRWFIWGVRRADVIIAQTRHQALLLKKNFNREGVVIPNLPAPDTFKPETPREFVIWVGRCTPSKRPELFIEVARAIPGQKFVLIAPAATAAAKQHYRQIAPAINALANLQYLDGVPWRETGEYFSRAKLLMNTSDFEGYPNTFIQAMQAGVPLASLHFDPDGMIAEKQLGVAPTHDLGLFIEHVRELLADPRQLADCGARGREYALQQHDLKKNVDRLIEVLRQLRA